MVEDERGGVNGGRKCGGWRGVGLKGGGERGIVIKLFIVPVFVSVFLYPSVISTTLHSVIYLLQMFSSTVLHKMFILKMPTPPPFSLLC